MTNRKGPYFETSVAGWLADRWCRFIDRYPPQGAKDRGDIQHFYLNKMTGPPLALELKNHVTPNLPGWQKEADDEAVNLNAVAGVIVHKRKGKTDPGLQWCTTTLENFLTIIEASIAEGKSNVNQPDA